MQTEPNTRASTMDEAKVLLWSPFWKLCSSLLPQAIKAIWKLRTLPSPQKHPHLGLSFLRPVLSEPWGSGHTLGSITGPGLFPVNPNKKVKLSMKGEGDVNLRFHRLPVACQLHVAISREISFWIGKWLWGGWDWLWRYPLVYGLAELLKSPYTEGHGRSFQLREAQGRT
jgi:hypothetical protein